MEKLKPLFGKNGTKKISLRRVNFSVPTPKRKSLRATFLDTANTKISVCKLTGSRNEQASLQKGPYCFDEKLLSF